MKRWLTQGEVAEALGLSRRRVTELLKEHDFPHLRISSTCLRYKLEDVEEILKTKIGVHYNAAKPTQPNECCTTSKN